MKKTLKIMCYVMIGIVLGAALTGFALADDLNRVTGVRSPQKVFVDGKEVDIIAYNINDNNYAQLRDVGQKVGFNVYWDGANVQIESNKPYTGVAPSGSSSQQTPAAQTNTSVTEADAKRIAFADAGVTAESNVTGYYAHLDYEKAEQVYDIRFYYNNVKYEYDISVASGKIVDKSQESSGGGSSTSTPAANGDIGEDAAFEIALKHAGLTKTQVPNPAKTEVDYERGTKVYEIKFYYNNVKYEYDIAVSNGEIIKWEKD